MKSNSILKVIIILLVAAAAGYGIYTSWPKSTSNQDESPASTEPVMCTMEAKLCADGSYVGRTGPKCEFAPCPSVSSTASWKTTTDSKTGMSFKYPENLGTKYISLVDWPPKIKVLSQAFVCTEGGVLSTQVGQVVKKNIGGKDYCVTTQAEGAAGSTFLQYAYAFGFSSKTVVATFTLREVQCANYDDPQKTECENERNTFNIDTVLAEMVSTVQVK